jgi:hypothetical protein
MIIATDNRCYRSERLMISMTRLANGSVAFSRIKRQVPREQLLHPIAGDWIGGESPHVEQITKPS